MWFWFWFDGSVGGAGICRGGNVLVGSMVVGLSKDSTHPKTQSDRFWVGLRIFWSGFRS